VQNDENKEKKKKKIGKIMDCFYTFLIDGVIMVLLKVKE